MAQIKITLTKGLVGRKPRQIKTIKALGLTKRNSTTIKDDSEMIRGMINVVSHLVLVEEVKK